MATLNPAAAARIEGRCHGIVPGDRADLTMFRWVPGGSLEIAATFISGSAAPL
jgi:hypothetical protein